MPPEASPLQSQIRAALLGLAVGDALGVPVEFESRARRKIDPVVTMRGYGTHNQPPGTWSDDASLTFCLVESLCRGYDLGDLSRRFINWYEHGYWTAHGQLFDVGVSTREALLRLSASPADSPLVGGTDEYSNGNGSLMRILPLAFYQPEASLDTRFQLIFDVSAITHGHVRSVVACFIYLEMAQRLRHGLAPAAAYQKLCNEVPAQLQQLRVPASETSHFRRILDGSLPDLPVAAIDSSGYVLHTLEAALWCLLRHETFAETVLAAVNLGDDTDTTGAVTGGLAGLYYGEAAIPPEWLAVLARREDIEELATRMAAAL